MSGEGGVEGRQRGAWEKQVLTPSLFNHVILGELTSPL